MTTAASTRRARVAIAQAASRDSRTRCRNNFPLIGFVHLILPNACIIDARRHPLDSLLGNYKQLYGGGLDYSYDLEDLAHYYRSTIG